MKILVAICFILGAAFVLLWNGTHIPVATVVSGTTSKPETVGGVQIGGHFSLVDQTGKVVTEKSWPGKFKLVFFGFTHCPDICPVTLQKISVVLEKLGAKAGRVQVLFVTVDPARDTPKAMEEYVANFSKSIIGLTGTEKQIKSIEDAYKVYAAKQPVNGEGDYDVDHSAYIYLMSPDDKAVEIIDDQLTAEEMAGKIKAHI